MVVAPSKCRGRLSHAWSRALRAVTVAKTLGCEWGLMGGVRAGDLQSAAPAGGAPAQHRDVRTRAPATLAPYSSSTWGGDGTPQRVPQSQSTALNPQSPILKPLFLSELSDLRPSRLRLGEAWVQQRPPSDHRSEDSQSPELRRLRLRASPAPPNKDPSFPVPGSPHLNFGGARAAKLSADLQRTPAPAAHRAPGEEREVGGEGEGAGLRGGRGRAVARHLPALSRPSRHRRRRREAEGEGRGGELRSAQGTTAAARSASAAPPAVLGSGSGVTPPRLARGGEGGEPAAPAPPPPPRGPN